MNIFHLTRRQFVQASVRGTGIFSLGYIPHEQTMITLYTFGDSILDCGWYNEFGINPGQLLVHNNNRLFPEFRGQDLQSHRQARLEHRACDGATVTGLRSQAQGLHLKGQAIALLTIGGNDLLRGLISDSGPGIAAFANALDEFLQQLPIRPVLLGNVYDPTCGDDRLNFLNIEPRVGRRNLQRLNVAIAKIAKRYGELVDLHAHFLNGAPSWFTATIEPSLHGASEIRRAFLPYVLSYV